MLFVFFFKQKTAYEMRISDWSSDVCSSDLQKRDRFVMIRHLHAIERPHEAFHVPGQMDVERTLGRANVRIAVERDEILIGQDVVSDILETLAGLAHPVDGHR